MRLIIGLVLFIAFSTQSFAYTMNDLQGKYRLTSNGFPVISTLSIDSKGNLLLVEEKGRFTCKGKSKLVGEVINAELKCQKAFENLKLQFGINLSEVADLNSFEAPLIFPMVGAILWKFDRLED